MKGPHVTLRAYQRAIVLVVALSSGLAFAFAVEHDVSWQEFVMGAAEAAATGLASGLSPLWRVLIGALVVFPLDIFTDGQFMTRPVELGHGFIQSVIFTWIIPYLDPSAQIWRWTADSKWSAVAFLKKCVVFGVYCVWLFVVMAVIYELALIAAQSGGMIAGTPSSDSVTSYFGDRIGAAATFSIAAMLILAVVLGLPFWRSRNSGSGCPEPRCAAAELPEFVAGAVDDTIGKQT